MYKLYFKKYIDVGIVLFTVPLYLPFIVMVTVINIILFRRDFIFTQIRIGYGGTPFKLYKFRSFTSADEISWWGKFIRQSSLDELPQLYNVLKGELSLIGPRPLLPEYLHLYTPAESLRHTVIPGLTGLAQLKGGNLLSWNERLKLDVLYAEKMCFYFDFSIFLKTLFILIKGKKVHFSSSLTEERGKKAFL